MTRNPTRDDVARQAQVSGATVSRVLSGKDNMSISDETRRRVLAAAEHLGYRANYNARALASGRTQLAALWIRHLHTPFHARIAHLTAFENKPAHYRVLISELPNTEGPDSSPLTGHPLIDGLIVHEGPQYARALLEDHRGARLPIVTIGASVLDLADHVRVDLYTGQWEALEHLYAIGCRKIAFLINRDAAANPSEERMLGYDRFMTEAGLQSDLLLTPELDQSRGTAFRLVKEYYSSHQAPDAILCLNDDMAVGANRALRELGLRVPDDVCLVGCDGIDDDQYQVPTITTIAQPVREMCHLAWEFLINRLEDPTLELQQILLQSHVIPAGSTRR